MDPIRFVAPALNPDPEQVANRQDPANRKEPNFKIGDRAGPGCQAACMRACAYQRYCEANQRRYKQGEYFSKFHSCPDNKLVSWLRKKERWIKGSKISECVPGWVGMLGLRTP
jgi:hypothetical protein